MQSQMHIYSIVARLLTDLNMETDMARKDIWDSDTALESATEGQDSPPPPPSSDSQKPNQINLENAIMTLHAGVRNRGTIVGGGGEADPLAAQVVLHHHNLIVASGEEWSGDIQRFLRPSLHKDHSFE